MTIDIALYFCFIMRTVAYDMLRREEVEWELQIRGIPPPYGGDVPLLVSQLKELKEVLPSASHVKDLDPVQVIDSLQQKKLEFSILIQDLLGDGEVSRNRCRRVVNRLNHLHNKILLLKTIDSFSGFFETLNTIFEEVIKFYSQINTLEMASVNNPIQPVVNGNNLSNNVIASTAEHDRYVVNCAVEQHLNSDSFLNADTTAAVNISPGYSNNIDPFISLRCNSEGFSSPHLLDSPVPNRVNTSLVPTCNSNLVLKYRKLELPHPLEPFIQSSVKYDIDSPENILAFLCYFAKLTSQLELFAYNLEDVYSVLAISSIGLLLKFVFQMRDERVRLDQFPRLLIRHYVDMRVRSQWLAAYFYRTQRPSESLADFVADIAFYSRVLVAEETDQQITDLIIKGLNSITRSQILFEARPTSLADLRVLALRVANYERVDSNVGSVVGGAVTQNLVGAAAAAAHTDIPLPDIKGGQRFSTAESSAFPSANSFSAPRNTQSRRPVICHYCGRPGHVIRFCHMRNRDTQRQTAGTSSPSPGVLNVPTQP